MRAESSLTFREFVMGEPVPLAEIQATVLEFLRHRDDAAVFGAQAVNAYVDEPRMTQDVDILSPRAAAVAEELRATLASRFDIAVRAGGRAYRLYQVRKPKNRHLADVRQVDTLPPTRRLGDVLVVSPEELVAGKVLAYHRRKGKPKSGTDWRDLAVLLLAFPELKVGDGPVRERLEAAGAADAVFKTWAELVAQEPLRTTTSSDRGWRDGSVFYSAFSVKTSSSRPLLKSTVSWPFSFQASRFVLSSFGTSV